MPHKLKLSYILSSLLKLSCKSIPPFYSNADTPGPKGNPNIPQIISSAVQNIKNDIEYGSMQDTRVPKPLSFSYRFIEASMIGREDSTGQRIFILLSEIRYAHCVSSGDIPKFINIGTNTGAKIAHFADA